MIVLNDIDGICIRIFIGAVGGAFGSFFGGLGVILFVKVVLIGWFKLDVLKDTVTLLRNLITKIH